MRQFLQHTQVRELEYCSRPRLWPKTTHGCFTDIEGELVQEVQAYLGDWIGRSA